MSIRRLRSVSILRGAALAALLLTGAVLLGCQDDAPNPIGPDALPRGASATTATGAVTFVGAGDIASCSKTEDEATATLLDGIAGTVFTAGDNVYADGSPSEFTNCYDPAWGRHKARTRPSPGNHDYHTSGAAGYHAYYGANAGPAGRGYYSYDLGAWHVVSLNSNVSMSAGSAQEQWLRADLEASTQQCTIAYWHHPRFSSGTAHGSFSAARPIWQALYDYGAEIVISGHEHNYERFAPQTPSGEADPVNGIREFVVGTGGVGHYSGYSKIANSEIFNASTSGVLKLTLGDGTYLWEFVPIAGKSFTDQGSGDCHGADSGSPPPDTTTPPPPSDTTSTPPPDTTTPPPPPGTVAPGRATRLTLTPTDTISIGPIGAAHHLLARAFNGTTEVATRVKWFVGASGSIAGLSNNLCTSPCYVTATGKALGTIKVTIHEYERGSTATKDTVWVKVMSTAPPDSSPPPSPTPPTLSRVVVVPASATLEVGQAKQFLAYGRMSNGDSVPVSTAWSATGGTISSGSYSAGPTAGAYRVIGVTGGLADTSSITVTPLPGPGPDPIPPPPPPGASARGCPSGGYTRLVAVSTNAQLTAALAGALPGDQIRVAAGTYASGLSWSKSGTEANPIVLCGVAGAPPVIRGVSFLSRGNYITILGIIFDGNLQTDNVVRLYGHHLVFSGNEIKNGRYHAGLYTHDTHHVTITYNYIHDNGVDHVIDHGIYFSRTLGSGNLIANNLVVHNAGRGISIHDNNLDGATDVLVAHNTVVNNGSHGISLGRASDRNVVVNNIVSHNNNFYEGKAIRVAEVGGDANVVKNNITWSPVASRRGVKNDGGSTVSGNVDLDPMFVAAFGSLHVRAGSPAVGLGLPGYSSGPSYDGTARTDGAPDAGAYER